MGRVTDPGINKRPPVIRVALLSIILLAIPYCSHAFWRDIYAESFSHLWAIAGWTIFIIFSIVSGFIKHQKAGKGLRTVCSSAWSYVHSVEFCVNATGAFLIFLIVVAMNVPRKFGHLESIVKQEQKISTDTRIENARVRTTSNFVFAHDPRFDSIDPKRRPIVTGAAHLEYEVNGSYWRSDFVSRRMIVALIPKDARIYQQIIEGERTGSELLYFHAAKPSLERAPGSAGNTSVWADFMLRPSGTNQSLASLTNAATLMIWNPIPFVTNYPVQIRKGRIRFVLGEFTHTISLPDIDVTNHYRFAEPWPRFADHGFEKVVKEFLSQ